MEHGTSAVGTMVSAFAAYGFAYLCLAFVALDLYGFLGTGTATSAEAPQLYNAAEVFPPLAAVVVLFLAVALTYRHLMSRIVAAAAAAVPVAGAAGSGRRSTLGLVMFALCMSAGALQFILFGQAAAAAVGHGGALGLAALRALPAAATATFFLGMMLIFVAHVRAGGEGGGGGAVVAGEGPIQRLPLRLLTKVTAGMAAALVVLMAMAVTLDLHGAKY